MQASAASRQWSRTFWWTGWYGLQVYGGFRPCYWWEIERGGAEIERDSEFKYASFSLPEHRLECRSRMSDCIGEHLTVEVINQSGQLGATFGKFYIVLHRYFVLRGVAVTEKVWPINRTINYNSLFRFGQRLSYGSWSSSNSCFPLSWLDPSSLSDTWCKRLSMVPSPSVLRVRVSWCVSHPVSNDPNDESYDLENTKNANGDGNWLGNWELM